MAPVFLCPDVPLLPAESADELSPGGTAVEAGPDELEPPAVDGGRLLVPVLDGGGAVPLDSTPLAASARAVVMLKVSSV